MKRFAEGLAASALASLAVAALSAWTAPAGAQTAAPTAAQPYGYGPTYPPPPPGYVPAPPPPPTPAAPRVVYDWDPDVPPPDGYEMISSVNGRMLGAGIGLLGSAWLLSSMVALAAQRAEEEDGHDGPDDTTAPDWTPLYIPIAGPFVAIGTLDPSAGGMGLLLADGIMQAAGTLGIILGIVDQEYKVVLGGKDEASVELAPAVGRQFQGMLVTGRF